MIVKKENLIKPRWSFPKQLFLPEAKAQERSAKCVTLRNPTLYCI